MISAALFSVLLAGPVILLDNISAEAKVPATLAATLDPLLCSTFEKSLKKAKFEVKCRTDIEAILKLRAMQSAVGSPTECNTDVEACAAQTAKLAHCTHVLVASLAKAKSGYTMLLTLVDTTGKTFATHQISGADADALLKRFPDAIPKIAAGLSKP